MMNDEGTSDMLAEILRMEVGETAEGSTDLKLWHTSANNPSDWRSAWVATGVDRMAMCTLDNEMIKNGANPRWMAFHVLNLLRESPDDLRYQSARDDCINNQAWARDMPSVQREMHGITMPTKSAKLSVKSKAHASSKNARICSQS
jgi:hypothetical protein